MNRHTNSFHTRSKMRLRVNNSPLEIKLQIHTAHPLHHTGSLLKQLVSIAFRNERPIRLMQTFSGKLILSPAALVIFMKAIRKGTIPSTCARDCSFLNRLFRVSKLPVLLGKTKHSLQNSRRKGLDQQPLFQRKLPALEKVVFASSVRCIPFMGRARKT